LVYLAAISIPEQERLQNPQYKAGTDSFRCTGCYRPCSLYCKICLENVAHNALQAYEKAVNDDDTITKTLLPTDRHPADDLCMLSAICLIKLFFIDGDSAESIDNIKTSYILQAIVLLEYGWSHSKSNFQISLLLVRLYCILGCGSLAFQRLGVKQIQLDTLSYALYDRISSLHPHSFGSHIHGASEFPNPVEHLEKQQKFYERTRDYVNRNRWTSLEHGSYNSIFEMKEFEDKIKHSISAAMSVVENRKIARLAHPGTPLGPASMGHDIFGKLMDPTFNGMYLTRSVALDQESSYEALSDTNDYESTPSFEATQAVPFGKFLQLGFGPSVRKSPPLEIGS
jgi:N-terminal acetyltransferase B complex non-catalytic subunit